MTDDDSIELPDEASEDATDRDGAFSYAAEYHAFTHGFYDAWKTSPRTLRAPELPDVVDVQREPHYYKGAFVLGSLTQWLVMVGGAALAQAAMNGQLPLPF